MLTKFTRHWCIKKKKKEEGDFIIYSERQKNQATECPSAWQVRHLLGKASYWREAWWAWKQSKWSYNYTASQHKMQEVLQLFHDRVRHLPGRLDACLNLAGASGQTMLCWVSQHSNWLLFFFSVLETEKMLFWWRFCMFACFPDASTLNYSQISLSKESLCFLGSRWLPWIESSWCSFPTLIFSEYFHFPAFWDQKGHRMVDSTSAYRFHKVSVKFKSTCICCANFMPTAVPGTK